MVFEWLLGVSKKSARHSWLDQESPYQVHIQQSGDSRLPAGQAWPSRE